jgi:hypothetical protein
MNCPIKVTGQRHIIRTNKQIAEHTDLRIVAVGRQCSLSFRLLPANCNYSEVCMLSYLFIGANDVALSGHPTASQCRRHRVRFADRAPPAAKKSAVRHRAQPDPRADAAKG